MGYRWGINAGKAVITMRCGAGTGLHARTPAAGYDRSVPQVGVPRRGWRALAIWSMGPDPTGRTHGIEGCQHSKKLHR